MPYTVNIPRANFVKESMIDPWYLRPLGEETLKY